MTDQLELSRADLPENIPAEQPVAMLDVIRQAASDPDVDVQKMQALLAMATELEAERRRIDFQAALARVQESIGPVEKNGTILLRTREGVVKGKIKFAKFEDIQAKVKPLLRAERFSTTYHEEIVEGAPVKKVTVTLHREGHAESCAVHIPLLDEGPGRNKAQAMVSANSYGRRRALIQILDITMEGEDDDGAGGAEPITEQQALDIEAALDELGGNKANFLKLMHVERFADITDLERANELLEKKRKQRATQ